MDYRPGTVLDIPIILMLTMAVIIGVLMAQTVLTEVIANTNDDQIDQDTLNKAATALNVFDKGIIVIFFGFVLFTAVLSFRIPSNPIFFLPAALFLGVTIWLSATFSNIVWQFMNVEPILTTVNNNYPTLVVFVENWPVSTAAAGLIILIALYLKGQRSPVEVNPV